MIAPTDFELDQLMYSFIMWVRLQNFLSFLVYTSILFVHFYLYLFDLTYFLETIKKKEFSIPTKYVKVDKRRSDFLNQLTQTMPCALMKSWKKWISRKSPNFTKVDSITKLQYTSLFTSTATEREKRWRGPSFLEVWMAMAVWAILNSSSFYFHLVFILIYLILLNNS